MATRKKKRFWNEGGIPGLDLPAPPKTEAQPAPHVPVTPSTGLVMSPRAVIRNMADEVDWKALGLTKPALYFDADLVDSTQPAPPTPEKK